MKSKKIEEKMHLMPIITGASLLILIAVAAQAWLYQKHKAEFFQQMFEQSDYRDNCMEQAMKATAHEMRPTWSGTERMAYAFTSDGYYACLKNEPRHPALEHFI